MPTAPPQISIQPLPSGSPSMWSGGFDEPKKNPEKNGDPWEVCNGYARNSTQELCESWKDEVDNLLIFAGLFSGVVTAFAIESYHSVKEDPSETTVLILKTIALQLDNMTNPRPDVPINLDPHMGAIPRSDKQINTLWFLSLTLSLSTVMAGILCLQWIREYGRNANVPHREDVALHHMRYEGVKKWHVFKVLSALPLLLMVALVLFFAGLIEVLWDVDKVAAIAVTIVVGIAFVFVLMTTLLPTLQCLYICAFPKSQFIQCPYKSPQAWMFLKSVRLFSYFVSHWTSGKTSCKKDPPKRFSDLFRIQNWPEYDQFLRRRRDDMNKSEGTLDVGRGLAWIGENFVQHQKLVDAVCRCLRDLEPQVALGGVLAQMNRRRADSVRRVQGEKPNPGPDSPQIRRGLTQDLIVSHTLEHFAEKIEQGHMSPILLHQRLDLFLKVNEGKGIGGDVECPLNHSNVDQIRQDTRLKVLSCIHTKLKKNIDCDATHTDGAFEIIWSIFAENQENNAIPQVVSETLEELILWVSRHPNNEGSTHDPEKRLKQVVMFHKLIQACKFQNDRELVDECRQGLENKIKAMFEKELAISSAGLRFPYLVRYLAWRQIR